ncbi:MAG TPA: 6-carboxytetrahydropterin synthase QueD [Verrucomicrobiae bacterium]|nr:6-carboxytetrahydropterin synthase QueD [Verrucomicrobiae bacterium]
MFKVTKHIDFCYGHRLLRYEGKCRHLHGHNGRVEVDIQTDKLDGRGMVHDFSDIKEVIKTWIDETLDHRMLLHKDDPILPILKQRGELYYAMDENPTAENIAKLIFQHARTMRLPVVEVRLWETPTSYATYRE